MPDPRCERGRRYSWLFLLAIVATAIVADQATVPEMALWAQEHAGELIAELQPMRPHMPSVANVRQVLRNIDLPA